MGGDVNTVGEFNGTALPVALFEMHEDVAKMLLKNRVDVNLHGGIYGNAGCKLSRSVVVCCNSIAA